MFGVALSCCTRALYGLQKTHNPVDRELLWEALPRVGVPQKMIAVIRQIPDGMRACVRTVDGELSEWFEVEQGLPKKRALSP